MTAESKQDYQGEATPPVLPNRESRVLTASKVSKTFGATHALEKVSLTLEPGEIHGLIGENGAGKSTLVKILSGIYRPDEGQVEIGGKPTADWSPEAAIASGLITVHQDVNLIESMTVVENVFLNAELTNGVWLNRAAMVEQTTNLLEKLQIEVSPYAVLGTLPTDLRKMVQLARALRQNPRVLLLDEPTSSLTAAEVDILIRQVKGIAASGVGVLYISHYLNEVFQHTQGLTILRDGRTAWQGRTADTTVTEAIRTMIGRALRKSPTRRDEVSVQNRPMLDVRNLSLGNRLTDISFSVQPGEILGIGGLIGAGLNDLARTIFADPEYRSTSGEILMDGLPVHWSSPADAMNAGVALVTNDRHRTGALTDFSISDNIGLPSLARFTSRFGILRRNELENAVATQIEKLSVKSAGAQAALATLSGGNQQKVMLAKWFMTNPRVLILDEPTIGVDIGAKQSIKDLIRQKASEGCAVVLLTSEMEELAEVADRAIVMFRGRIVARLNVAGFTQADLTNAANASSEFQARQDSPLVETMK